MFFFLREDCTIGSVLTQTNKKGRVYETEGRLWGCCYFETSAQTCEGIDDMLQVRELL